MQPVVISETIQEFAGTRFYRCGTYFQRRGVRLHRVVWTTANGPVPDGHHVHHIDGNPANNALSNLQCIRAEDHLAGEHGPASGWRGKKSIAKAIRAAASWHGSAAGKKWHAEHFEKHIRAVMEKRVPAVCVECGADYLVSAAKVAQGKFCSGACKARALRKRRRAERTR